jgi:signal transduction histidine kinase/CheY-like chemotaxis protein/ligand-binding sensor domain-containing protein
LLVDGDSLWLGTFNAGLYKVNLQTGHYTHLLPDPNEEGSIGHNQITTLYKDSFDNLWVGSFAGGLSRLPPGSSRFDHFEASKGDDSTLSDNTVYAIYQERNGDLWVGTNNGLNRFNYETGTFERFMHDRDKPGTLSSRVVFSLYEDAEARLWVGTQGGGLNIWEPVDRKRSQQNFQYFQSNIRLPSSTIYSIQGDEEGNAWLATSGGLTRFNYNAGEAKNFTVDDGLQSNDFNLGASFRDSDGILYFGGTSGLNILDPGNIRTNTVAPRIALTRVSLGNEQVWFDKPYSELDRIELQPDDYMLGFAFAALDFNAPARNQYRYQMVGLDQNWVDLANRNTLDFSKLPVGQYVLRIQGANPDGIWSPSGIAIDILVHPPFYLTWYAFVVYFSTVLALVLSVIWQLRRKAQRRLLYQAQLEADVRARTQDLRRSNEKLQTAVKEIGRARQEAVEANQAKSDFLAALSHEIRTPMHGVLGMTDLLLHSGLGGRQQEFAQSAQKSANELLGLIDNILDFSKIEAGKIELEETTFNLRDEMENLCYLYAELAQAKNIELNLVFNADLRRQLYGDPVRLRQILQNLLSNAIKFTRRGSVNLLINETSREGKRVELEFVVEDTGIGMDEDTINRVFEAFSQADSSTTRQYGGTGLGLSIAKQLVELMQGLLTVHSKPGVGTTMRVALSLEESPIYTDQLATGLLGDFNAEVVALMPETRAMFRSQIEAINLRVRECATVEELAPVAEQSRLVLVDVSSLFDSAGIAQLANIAEDPSSTVLLITPLTGEGIPPELAQLHHTTKPVRLATLVSDILAAHRNEQQPEIDSRAPLKRFHKRVLLVEDITANQEIARAMLESFGCTVAIAKHGEVALEMIQQDEYDIVLMDCQMPVMDGFQATRHIRQYEMQHPSRGRTPVVALTAGKTETEKERCFASGMDRILFKPYSTEELNELLAKYFDSNGVIGGSAERSAAEGISGDQSFAELLDYETLNNIRNIDAQGSGGLLLSVFENFKSDAAGKLDELRTAGNDVDVLGAGAHAIKSMSLNMGARALSDYCRACEAQWKQGDIGDAPRQIEVMAGHLRDALRALEQELELGEEAL